MSEVSISVAGQQFTGWHSAQVTRTMIAASGGFRLDVAGLESHLTIRTEDECVIKLDKQQVIKGYVDRLEGSLDARSHSFSVSGRDAVSLLIDCSVDLGKWEFHNLSLLAFVKKVVEPFGIPVTLQAGIVPAVPKKLSIDPGDTAIDVIERYCRFAGLLAMSDGNGGLLLTRASKTQTTTALIEGQNVVSADYSYKHDDRFHTYKVIGQQEGTLEDWGASVVKVRGEATDAGVNARRTLIVRPEGSVTRALAGKRAQWEATTRAARASSLNVTVSGWTQGDGTLWPVNQLVGVEIPSLLDVGGFWLITEANYSLDNSQGTRTQLTLARPDAFSPEPVTLPSKADQRFHELDEGA